MKKASGYVERGTPEHELAEALSKAAWIDLYIDLWRQTCGEEAPLADALADAYARLVVLEDNGIREHSATAAATWRAFSAGKLYAQQHKG